MTEINNILINRLILDIFHREDIEITKSNIKISFTNKILMSSIKTFCDFVKNAHLPHVVIFNIYVPHKRLIEQKENIRIYDADNLISLAIKHGSYQLVDLINSNQ